MFTDTHVHFDPAASEEAIEGWIARAQAAQVTRLIAVGHNPAANETALRVAARFPGIVRAALGYDRTMATTNPDPADLLRAPGCSPVAIGEIGLDFHYSPETAEAQCRLMEAQLALARSRNLPVIVHSRDADKETLDLLRAHRAAWTGDADRIGVLHCFTEDEPFARELLDLGFFISFSGIVTFRNAGPLRAVAAMVPADRLLIETDSPYLAPVPHRGKTNEPSFLPAVAAVVAAARGVSAEEIAALTSRNAGRLFRQEWA